jgi:hypothetical protein
VFSYPLLGFPLGATCSMEDMQRSTFHTSSIERDRRRSSGTVLTLVPGTGSSTTPSHDVPDWHPASEDFTPDEAPGATRLQLVRDSEPGSPTLRSTSRGSAIPDNAGMATPGSGPIITRGELLERITRFLEETAGEPPVDRPVHQVHQVR